MDEIPSIQNIDKKSKFYFISGSAFLLLLIIIAIMIFILLGKENSKSEKLSKNDKIITISQEKLDL